MRNIVIRLLCPDDHGQWLAMWPDYVDEYIPTEATLAAVWDRLNGDAFTMYGLVAVDKQSDKLIGFLHYNLHRTTWCEGYECCVEDVYVEKDFRGQRLFARLYSVLREDMVARGDCRTIYWRTNERNFPAMKAYDRVAKQTNWVRYEDKIMQTTEKIK